MCVSKKTSKQTIEQCLKNSCEHWNLLVTLYSPPIFPATHSVKGGELSGDDAPRDEHGKDPVEEEIH